MPRLDQNETRRIEAETVEAVPAKPAVPAPLIGRQDENERIGSRQAGQERRDEAEGRRKRSIGRGDDFVERPAGQAAFRQMLIERGKSEG